MKFSNVCGWDWCKFVRKFESKCKSKNKIILGTIARSRIEFNSNWSNQSGMSRCMHTYVTRCGAWADCGAHAPVIPARSALASAIKWCDKIYRHVTKQSLDSTLSMMWNFPPLPRGSMRVSRERHFAFSCSTRVIFPEFLDTDTSRET